jgi:hypothetical protein
MSIDTYRKNVVRLTKEKADIDKQISRENEKIARIESEIASITRRITSSTSLSTIRSKQRQIESKNKGSVRVQQKASDLLKMSARKLEELNRCLQHIEHAERHRKRKYAGEATRRRAEELRHTRELTRETAKQARLHSELGQSRLVIDLSMLPEKIKVLFLAANPQDWSQMRLDEEMRLIKQKLRASKYRDSVELLSEWAVRPGDILQALNEHQPHIVHFSGHGSDAEEIVLQYDAGRSKLVTKEAITATMSTMADNIRVVLFNACFSSGQAEAVTQHVDVAIGMADAIGDEAARVFAAQFYSAIGFGRSVQDAFNQAKTEMMLEGIPEEDTPVLYSREGIEPTDIVLVRPSNLGNYEQDLISEVRSSEN